MADAQIHDARKGDASIIARLSRRLVEAGLEPAWTESRVDRCRQDADARVLVARQGAALVGGAILNFEDDAAHLGLLVVDTAFQRRGLGAQLLRAAEAAAMAAGLPRMRLEVRMGNTAGQAFYLAQGYQAGRTLARYYGANEDALRFERDLRVGINR